MLLYLTCLYKQITFLTNADHNTWTVSNNIPYYTLYVSKKLICSMWIKKKFLTINKTLSFVRHFSRNVTSVSSEVQLSKLFFPTWGGIHVSFPIGKSFFQFFQEHMNAGSHTSKVSPAVRACADELSEVFIHIFNQSLSLSVVPTGLKTSTIIPIFKQSSIRSLNDYLPIALMHLIKCFEKLVLAHRKTCVPPTTDPHLCAYHANRSTEDATGTALHQSLLHLKQKNTYFRMLFVDYSFAFNTITASLLTTKLVSFYWPGFSTSLCNYS